MVNFKTVAIAFVVLTIIFAATTGYLVAYPAKTTQTSTTTQTTTLSGNSSSYTVNIAYKAGIGFYLTNGTGFTLYYRSTDKPYNGTTTCTSDTCEKNWPVFYSSTLNLPTGLNSSSFSVITPYNSTKFLTYSGYPLYHWAHDAAPGDTTGQRVGGFYVATLPTPTEPSATTTTSSTSASGATGAVVNVNMPSGASQNQSSLGNLGFYPNTITVVIGVNNTVMWTNNDVTTHTVTSSSVPYGAQAFIDYLNPGNTFELTFTVPGIYEYHCSIHVWMHGTIIVES